MNPQEKSLLRTMMKEGLLTIQQGRRVARAIEHGATIEEAIGRTPLIDSLEYHKLLRQSEPPEPGEEAPPSPSNPADIGDLTPVATYDLMEDEGIPLLQRLYELIGEVLYGGMSALEVGRVEMESGWSKVFDGRGQCLATRSITAGEAEKMMARLRVMGRIGPSKRTAQRSLIILQGNGIHAQGLLESEGDVVRMTLLRDSA